MTTLELFVNTIILSLLVGIIVGGLAMELLVVRPLRARHAREHKRVLNAFRHSTRHLGTPYLVPPGLPEELNSALTDLSDNDRWSRKARDPLTVLVNDGYPLPVTNTDSSLVSLPRPRVQTGRPV